MSKSIENKLIEEFKQKGVFSRVELFDFFRSFEPNLGKETFGWRIYDLMNRNIINPIRRGYYSMSFKQKYDPAVSAEFLKVAKILATQFAEIKYCMWETDWMNEFSQHQSGKQLLVIEVEKQIEESVFYALKDALHLDIYLNPDEKVINLYVSESKKPVVVKKLITRSPIVKRTNKKTHFHTPLLEKILVDLFIEEKLFYFYQGAELVHIYENILKNYSINYTKLFSYAKRRERELEIKQFLEEHLSHLVKDLF